MKPLKVVFLDAETFPAGTFPTQFSFPADVTFHPRTAVQMVGARIGDADIVLSNKVPIGREDMADASRLKLIAVTATGTNNVDLVAAAERGIVVSNVTDYAGSSVAEHTFALILALKRSLVAYQESVRAGDWQEAQQFCYRGHPISDLSGTTLGIMGAGTLGSAVARLGSAFGMTVLLAGRKGDANPKPGRTPFDQVIEHSDVLSLHLPLLPETRNLLGEREFADMRRRPLLINTARGGLVDEDALLTAMRTGQIAGAGFDVASVEPPPPDHILMQLLELPNFLLTPHVAWASDGAIRRLVEEVIRNIESFVAGHPRNVVS